MNDRYQKIRNTPALTKPGRGEASEDVLQVRIAEDVNTFGGDRERSRRKTVNTCGGKV